MSAIAECFTVDASKLTAFLSGGIDRDALVAGADRVTYGWSGYVLATLLPYLDEQGVLLMKSVNGESLSRALQTTCFALTPEHRGFLDRLDAAKFDGEALRATTRHSMRPPRKVSRSRCSMAFDSCTRRSPACVTTPSVWS